MIYFILSAWTRYLNTVFDMDMSPNQEWYCNIVAISMSSASLCSTSFILNMTFARCYSIIRPHKAASFNTIKRAKITIISIVIFSIIFNIPTFFNMAYSWRNCLAHAKTLHTLYGQIYYWISFLVNFAIPFVLLLAMNTVIIHTLRTRSTQIQSVSRGQGQAEGQGHVREKSITNSEKQIYITLLLVTFGFLILTIPRYIMMFALRSVNVNSSAYTYASYFLCYHIGQKANFTNFGVNFFLYVLSGNKFRSDLVQLFRCSKKRLGESSVSSTKISHIEAEH